MPFTKRRFKPNFKKTSKKVGGFSIRQVSSPNWPSKAPKGARQEASAKGGGQKVSHQEAIGRTNARRQTPRLRLIPLGGLEEIGKNCLAIEFSQDIILIDLGFQFPDEEMPGIDYVIPDTSYLQKNRDKIRGVIITHGHMDHTGAIPYIIKNIGNPPIFGTCLTIGLIKQRLEEFKLEKYAKLNTFHPDDTLKLGGFKLTFFRVNHNIPDGVGVVIHTPLGILVHTGDFKFDDHPVDDLPTEFAKIKKVSQEKVLVLFSDSTNAENPGHSLSEEVIGESIEKIFEQSRGRIIFTTFASLTSRIQQVINAASKYQRKVAVSGLSMEKTVEVALRLGYLKLPKKIFVKIDRVQNYPDNQLVILSTGSQGQEMSALARMTRGEHRQIQIKKDDTIVLSSSPIPGNERAIHNIMNRLVDAGARVIYKKTLDIHTSGHGNQDELKEMIKMVKPQYFVPVHGEHYMQIHHSYLAQEVGIPEKNIFMLFNGDSLEINQGRQAKIIRNQIPAEYVMVDGLGVGDVGNVVLRDRQVMARDGMVVVIAAIDKNRHLVNAPDIISRGFVYMKASEKLIKETKNRVTQIVKNYTNNQSKSINWSPLRSLIRDDVGQFLFAKTERRPMILPLVIEV